MNYIEDINLNQIPVNYHHRKSSVETTWRIFHTHQGIEFLYIHKGSGYAIFDHTVHEVKAGTLLFFQPLQLHGLKIHEKDDEPYIRTILTLDPVIIEPYLTVFPGLREFFQTLCKNRIEKQFFSEFTTRPMFEYFLEYFCLRQKSIKNNSEEMIFLAISFLNYVRGIWQQKVNTSTKIPGRTTDYAAKIMQWINEHYMEEFSLKRLAEDLHLSEYHTSHLFRKATGTSITDYLTARRMRQASFLLQSDTLPLNIICQQVGITSTSYFCQVFKRTMGISPGTFRASINKSKQFIDLND